MNTNDFSQQNLNSFDPYGGDQDEIEINDQSCQGIDNIKSENSQNQNQVIDTKSLNVTRQKNIQDKDCYLETLQLIKNPQNYNYEILRTLKNKVQEYENMKKNELRQYSKKYENKLERFKRRKLMKQMEQHQFNILCQQLLRQQKKYSTEIIKQEFVNMFFDWINLLDLAKEKEIYQQLDEIIEILQQQHNFKQDQYYCNKYQKYDFAKLSISLIDIFISIQIQDVKQNRHQWEIDEEFSYLSTKYAKFFTSLCDLRAKKYERKKQLNFTKQTIEMLLKNENAKKELQEVIQNGIKNPYSWFKYDKIFKLDTRKKLITMLKIIGEMYKLI